MKNSSATVTERSLDDEVDAALRAGDEMQLRECLLKLTARLHELPKLNPSKMANQLKVALEIETLAMSYVFILETVANSLFGDAKHVSRSFKQKYPRPLTFKDGWPGRRPHSKSNEFTLKQQVWKYLRKLQEANLFTKPYLMAKDVAATFEIRKDTASAFVNEYLARNPDAFKVSKVPKREGV